ncbi:DNA polymerase III subunit chi [Rhizomicrobium electricum]|jgi:DNA polymerase-3 subunit chi|uniref:DNA polymerase III subunit chi n=1 Tax=Rhizomicrobium electricum TaxID=480070 RepID=A0ABP3PFG0_9PROT|nr:DNA polymerase III subunit chi [Rhizomicrobium electricum]NIJ48208.1 DNA polymerase-3 subunit chi [Rhizomicrobium electricum]
MSETLFYHLERRALEDVLPGLVEKSLQRGWRAVIKTESADRADALDTLLWTFNDGFLPHAQLGDGEAARQPVLITTEDGNPNGAAILFLVGGVAPPDWNADATRALARIVLMFDGHDPSALQVARESWKAAKAAGHDVTYWKESPTGKWEKQG